MSLLFSSSRLVFFPLAASGLYIKYNYSMFTGNSNPQEVIFEEKSQKSAVTVEAGSFFLLVVRQA